MRQKGEHCLPDLASTALCMNSRLFKGQPVRSLLLRKRCHCGSRQKSCLVVTSHIGDSPHHWRLAKEGVKNKKWRLWLPTKFTGKLQQLELPCNFAVCKCKVLTSPTKRHPWLAR